MKKWCLLAMAAIIVGLSACQPSPRSTPSTTPSSEVAATALPTPTALPSEKPVDELPPPGGFPQFLCQTQGLGTGKADLPQNNMTAIRTGRHGDKGYDRFVMEFDSTRWSATATPQPSSVFTRDPKGDQVSLLGSTGIRVTVNNTASHDKSGTPSTILNSVTGYKEIRQVAQLGDNEGVVTWGIGIAKPNCFRTFILPGGSGPNGSRLVVDIEQ